MTPRQHSIDDVIEVAMQKLERAKHGPLVGQVCVRVTVVLRRDKRNGKVTCLEHSLHPITPNAIHRDGNEFYLLTSCHRSTPHFLEFGMFKNPLNNKWEVDGKDMLEFRFKKSCLPLRPVDYDIRSTKTYRGKTVISGCIVPPPYLKNMPKGMIPTYEYGRPITDN